MELSMPTFLWLRDVGCVSTEHILPSRNKGMIMLSPTGLNILQCGFTIVRLLKHYCCHRFDIPAVLDPVDGNTLQDKRHNWTIIGHILKEALGYELPWERRELILSGDTVELMVLLKQIHELVKPHREVDREWKIRHKEVHNNPHKEYVKQRLDQPFDSGMQRDPHEHHKPWLPNSTLSQERTRSRSPGKTTPQARSPEPRSHSSQQKPHTKQLRDKQSHFGYASRSPARTQSKEARQEKEAPPPDIKVEGEGDL